MAFVFVFLFHFVYPSEYYIFVILFISIFPTIFCLSTRMQRHWLSSMRHHKTPKSLKSHGTPKFFWWKSNFSSKVLQTLCENPSSFLKNASNKAVKDHTNEENHTNNHIIHDINHIYFIKCQLVWWLHGNCQCRTAIGTTVFTYIKSVRHLPLCVVCSNWICPLFENWIPQATVIWNSCCDANLHTD